MDKKTWQEFRDAGMLWFVNMILHAFGWAIVFDFEDDEIIDVYPARVIFRGFSESINTDGYRKLSRYLNQNIADLLKEAEE